jgi:hypothetical protein
MYPGHCRFRRKDAEEPYRLHIHGFLIFIVIDESACIISLHFEIKGE